MTISLPAVNQLELFAQSAELFRSRVSGRSLFPFGPGDSSAGMEFELQVSVAGSSETTDLPLTIRQSAYFRNLIKRSERGDCSRKLVDDLSSFLDDERTTVWENSWVRLQTRSLSDYAVKILEHDLRADKSRPDSPLRSDKHSFFCIHKGEQWLRLPVSYVLKLALADCSGRTTGLPPAVDRRLRGFQDHFLSDNTSPEILSLALSDSSRNTIGPAAASEATRTFFFTQLLLQYANAQFRLTETGQHALLYFSPQAPQQQKTINELVPDSFYRQLFMSPCLSGWDRGEEKNHYMALCHRTLSRSQLNTIAKLREAEIITNNLIVLPNTSNTCLANNGTHISLGSKTLTAMAADPDSGFGAQVEKYFGDLVIKIVEHFLPLLVGTSTAAPYRIDFADFHPEKVLGFLPHELDYTHLRMLWRRWKNKADIRVFGRPLTPFGPRHLDRFIAGATRSRGDYLPDFRLIDYLVALLSTETSPALDGIPGNQRRLRRDLAEMGVFDHRMSMYLPYRHRQYARKGYSGFEGRSYSLFPSLLDDLADAATLQNLFTALAYRLILEGTVRHRDIPDNPTCESERRQIFFAAAIGIPTVYLDSRTPNRLLGSIGNYLRNQRRSRRYRGYLRVPVHDYQMALIRLIRTEAPDIVAQLEAAAALDRLELQLSDHRQSAAGRLSGGILRFEGRCRQPLQVAAPRFNQASERFYRHELRRHHLWEGLSTMLQDCAQPEIKNAPLFGDVGRSLGLESTPEAFLKTHASGIIAESLSPRTLRQLIVLSGTVIDLLEQQR